MGIHLSDFYDHRSFLRSVHEGEARMTKDLAELSSMERQVSDIKAGDIVESTGKGSRIPGIKAKVLSVEYNGKFLRFLVDWDSKSRRHCQTFERLQDIKPLG